MHAAGITTYICIMKGYRNSCSVQSGASSAIDSPFTYSLTKKPLDSAMLIFPLYDIHSRMGKIHIRDPAANLDSSNLACSRPLGSAARRPSDELF